MFEIKIDVRDEALRRFANQLGALGDGLAKTVMARALNHEGDKGRTQVKRTLVKQTGIRYGKINEAVKTVRATRMTLEYRIEARGEETNLNLFGARDRSGLRMNLKGADVGKAQQADQKNRSGVSAAPWGRRMIFKHSFIVPAYGDRVYIRTEKGSRFPLRQVFGPNIARELVKAETAETFRKGSAGIADRIAHEIARVLPK